ncbi:type I secretion system permease/ATPase [Pseudoruegeria sp. HB172150]|uniref:type I secretion system permease/ATPase n=1 Tax=Pseudoruegeria sp. HB172150 TaxID=2721164 RepID=UPI0015527467|nr:type I secretion system permease/ATPase [Pseudoruegeria sp. HB172150]
MGKEGQTLATPGSGPTTAAVSIGRARATGGQSARGWSFARTQRDPLAAAIVACMKSLGRDVGCETLIAGLPLPNDGRLTPQLGCTAAEAQGFRARLTRRNLADLPDAVFPAVLFLKDRQACVLHGWSEDKAQVSLPARSSDALQLTRAELLDLYVGHALLLRPEPGSETFQAAQQPGAEPRHWYWSVASRFWPDYLQVVVASALVNVLALATPIFTMNVYDRVFPNAAIITLWSLVIGVAIALCFDGILKWIRSMVIDRIGRRVDQSVSASLFRHISDIKLASQALPSGTLLNVLKDYEQVRDFFSSQTLATLTDLCFAVLFVAVIGYIAGPLALPPAIALGLVLLMGVFVLAPMRNASNESRQTQGVKNAVAVEAITEIETLKAISGQGRMQQRWERQVAESASAQDRSKRLATFATTFTALVQQLSSVGIIIIGVYMALDGRITMGAVIASMILSSRALAPTATLASLFVRASFAFSTLRSLNQIMALPSDRRGTGGNLNAAIQQGRFTLENVGLTYGDSKQPALDGITLNVKSMERLAVIGAVGAGKTSLVRLVAGLYEPTGGMVLLDGLNLAQLSRAKVRREVQLVPQEAVLFSGTLAENIAFGMPDSTAEEVTRVARITGVDQIAAQHPLGFAMPISERGRNLSGGQRQMIALARALLPRPRVLILDEPTSAMDMQSEKQFIDRLATALEERPMTLIVSTHRMGLLDLVDRLVLLDGGRVVQDGPKGKVLAALERAGRERRA